MVGFKTRSLALVARALSEDYGVTITVGGSEVFTAFAEGKRPVINIPALDIKDAKYQALVRGYLDHEAGHVRFTAFSGKVNPADARGVKHKIANVYEDVYIERLMGQCFPGCKRNLARVEAIIFTENDDPDAPAELLTALQSGKIGQDQMAMAMWGAILNYILFRVRGQVHSGIARFIPKHKAPLDLMIPGLAAVIDPILDRVPAEGVSTEANKALAEETEKAIRDFMKENKDQVEKQQGKPGQPNQTDQPGQPNQTDQPGQPDETGQPGQSVADAFDEAADNMTKDDGPQTDIGKQIADAVETATGNDKETRNDHPYRVKSEEFKSDAWATHVKELSATEVREALQASTALDAQLQSLLQTYVLNRGGLGRVGKLDTNRLHKLAVGSDKIFRRRTEKRGVNTEIVLCIDMSGSMGEQDKATITSMSLYAVMKSLRKIRGCTSSVMGFYNQEVLDILGADDPVTTQMRINPTGNTLCGEALFAAMYRFKSSPDTRKIVIMMTDGVSSNSGYFEHVTRSAIASGIELVGLGIQDDAIRRTFPVEDCCVVKNMSQMTPALFRILRNKLVGRAA